MTLPRVSRNSRIVADNVQYDTPETDNGSTSANRRTPLPVVDTPSSAPNPAKSSSPKQSTRIIPTASVKRTANKHTLKPAKFKRKVGAKKPTTRPVREVVPRSSGIIAGASGTNQKPPLPTPIKPLFAVPHA
ncbi:unnamed protein product [Enterobius vermicularis]|uniref:Uncharacterized protein n=1 Tax=Enterobius vermicularis TaxID=51028 RepID=A0A0N4VB43_ENTVE|nr:unnamed protein product [Enterobius vermicularis]